MPFISVLIFLLITLSGCTPILDATVNAPAYLEQDMRVSTVIFNTKNNLKLDVYQPKEDTKKIRDVVVFFYGGSWQNGERGFYRFVAQTLVKNGFIVVIPDYRQYPDIKFPTFLFDSAHAVAWTYRNIESYGGNKSRLNILGHSAGAYNAAMIVADKKYLDAYGLNPSKIIHRFVGLAGPYAFEPDTDTLKDIFADAKPISNMQVPGFVTGNMPPTLLIQGQDDTVVGLFNGERLYKALKSNKVDAQLQAYDGLGHIGLIKAFSWAADKQELNVRNAVIDFFHQP